MTTLARRNSSIHKIREYTLPKVDLEEEYEIIHPIQEGWRGRLLLVEHKRTRHEVVLKAIHKETTSRVEFFREFHYNYYLSPHTNILNAYDVAFLSGDYYVFAQEYAPFGDLTSNLTETGLGEVNVKKIAPQLVSALEFMHSKDLVHRNINMDNILVFNIDFSEVKLCDFGFTKKNGVLLKKKTDWLPYAPPEIVATVQNEGFHVSSKHDVWQLGILLYVLLTGALPWQKADLTDPHYMEFINWKKRKTLKTPKRFSNFTTRALRMFKRLLEPKEDKRSSVKEVRKYIEDKWLTRPMKRQDKEIDSQSVCYSTVSIHSSKIEKDIVLHALKAIGIETTVDRVAKRKRIHEWIERSLTNNHMFEEEEEDEEETISTNNNIIKKESPWYDNEPDNIYESNENDIHNGSKYNDIRQINLFSKKNSPLKQTAEPSSDRGRIVSISQLDCSRIIRSNSYRSRETLIASSQKPVSRNKSFNAERRPSIQDNKRTMASVGVIPSNELNSSKVTSSTKSQYHQSPSRDPYSPLRVHSQSQILSTLETGEDKSNKNPENVSMNKNQFQTSRSRTSYKNAAAVRSNSERLKTRTNLKSHSISRHHDSSEFNIQRSRTAPSVDVDDPQLLKKYDSDCSLSRSDDSLTSVFPMAFNS